MATKQEAQIETVTMDDGRVVDFPGKRRLQKTSEISESGVITVRLDFINGTTTLFTVPDALLHRFAAHGAEQKLGVGGVDEDQEPAEPLLRGHHEGLSAGGVGNGSLDRNGLRPCQSVQVG